jgi:hypothetical protein
MTRIPLNPRSKALADFLTGEDPKPAEKPKPVQLDPYVRKALDRSTKGGA